MPKFNPDKYADDYKRRNYDRINLLLPKGYRDKLRTAAINAGFPSVNAMFNSLAADMIRQYLKPQEPTGTGADHQATAATAPAPDEFPADPPEPDGQIHEGAEPEPTAQDSPGEE